MQPLPPSYSIVDERNSVYGYDRRQNDKINNEQNTAQNDRLSTITTIKTTTSANVDSVNKINKRRRTGDDVLDAFLEISDIMTYNQMQPIEHAHNSSVLPLQRQIDNSVEIDNVDNIDDVYNVDDNNKIKRRKTRRGGQKKQKSQHLRDKERKL